MKESTRGERVRLLVFPPSKRAETLQDYRYRGHSKNIRRYAPRLDFAIMSANTELSDVPRDSFVMLDVEGKEGLEWLMNLPIGDRARIVVARIGALGERESATDAELTSFMEVTGVAGGFPLTSFRAPNGLLNYFAGRVDLLRQCSSLRASQLAGKACESFARVQVAGWKWFPEYCQAVRSALGDGWGKVGLPPAVEGTHP